MKNKPMDNLTEAQILSAKRLSAKGLAVQEIAYRLSIDILILKKIICSTSYIDSEGKLILN